MQEASQNSSNLSNGQFCWLLRKPEYPEKTTDETGVPRENYRPVTKMEKEGCRMVNFVVCTPVSYTNKSGHLHINEILFSFMWCYRCIVAEIIPENSSSNVILIWMESLRLTTPPPLMSVLELE
jgi:hypothetical protein